MADMDFEGRIFEQPDGTVEKDRSRLIMIISGIAVFIVVGLIVLQQTYHSDSAKIDLARAGSPEFDSYKDSVVLSNVETFTGKRLNINYARMVGRVQNTGDKSIIGLQLRMAAIDLDSQTRKEKLIIIIPSQLTGRKSLEPNDVIDIELNLEPTPDPGELMDIIVEIVGLKVK